SKQRTSQRSTRSKLCLGGRRRLRLGRVIRLKGCCQIYHLWRAQRCHRDCRRTTSSTACKMLDSRRTQRLQVSRQVADVLVVHADERRRTRTGRWHLRQRRRGDRRRRTNRDRMEVEAAVIRELCTVFFAIVQLVFILPMVPFVLVVRLAGTTMNQLHPNPV